MKFLESYGDERRTEIVASMADEIQIEDLIKNEEVIVTITHKGYLKRMPAIPIKLKNVVEKVLKVLQVKMIFYIYFYS
jgi:DNA gyrase/topoisomerase IV subunit A